MKKFSLLSVLFLVAASTAILEAQSRFKDAADSLDYWHNRRFLIGGMKAYTKAELDSMTAAALRQDTIKGVDLQEGPVFPDSTDGPQSYQTLFKNIRAGDETTAEPMVAVSPVNRNNFIAVYMRKVTGEWRPAASYTLNGGDSWTASDIPSGWYFYLRQADPVIDFDASGNAWYAWLDHDDLSSSHRNAILVGQSLSNGSSWSNQYVVVNDANPNTTTFNDKPWITTHRTPGPYQNSVYVTWTRTTNNANNWQILLSYKRAGSADFSTECTD